MPPLLFFSFAVVATTSVLAASTVPLERTSIRLLTVPLLTYLQIVIVGRVLGLVGLLGHQGAWCLFELLLLGVMVATWGLWPTALILAARGPRRSGLWFGTRTQRAHHRRRVHGCRYTLLLVASVLIPQNIDDVLTAYRSLRYWIHAGDLAPFERRPTTRTDLVPRERSTADSPVNRPRWGDRSSG